MDSPADRAAHYRTQAAQLRVMAAEQIEGSMIKDQLLDLAAQYDRLATQIENGGPYRR
jgi:hypothetical protein